MAKVLALLGTRGRAHDVLHTSKANVLVAIGRLGVGVAVKLKFQNPAHVLEDTKSLVVSVSGMVLTNALQDSREVGTGA